MGKLIRVKVRTGVVGSGVETEFSVDAETSSGEVEEMAFEAACDLMDWQYTIDGKTPE